MRSQRHRTRGLRGVVFIATLWILTAMTALAIALAMNASTEANQAANAAATIEVRGAEAAGLRYVLGGLTTSSGLMPSGTDLPCCAVQVGQGAFWVIRPSDSDDRQRQYGLTDEGGKIDLNSAPEDVLLALPSVTDEVAASIIDWRDPDDTVTPSGAESDFYLRQKEPYQAKNSPFESGQELALVAGMTQQILYGEDYNRNGVLDAREDDGDATPPEDDHNGKLDRGLIGLTTAYVHWPATTGGATPAQQSVNANTASRQQLLGVLTQSLDSSRAIELADMIMLRRPFGSIFDLYFTCGLSVPEFEAMEDRLSFSTSAFRLNVNAAGADVLATLPGLGEADATSLLQARAGISPNASLSWMLTALTPEKLRSAGAVRLERRSYQYTADIVAISADGRAFRRGLYTIDMASGTPRVIGHEDLTHLGWPLDETVVQRLRAGQDFATVLADERNAQ